MKDESFIDYLERIILNENRKITIDNIINGTNNPLSSLSDILNSTNPCCEIPL